MLNQLTNSDDLLTEFPHVASHLRMYPVFGGKLLSLKKEYIKVGYRKRSQKERQSNKADVDVSQY